MSGMYMGEIVRLIILDLWEKELLFVGHRDHHWSTDYRQALYTKGSFYTKYVSEIETDSGVTFRHTKQVLEHMGLDKPTYDDCAIVQYVCKLVSRRAAQLAACGEFFSNKKKAKTNSQRLLIFYSFLISFETSRTTVARVIVF